MNALLEFESPYEFKPKPGYEGEVYHFVSEDGSYQTWSYNSEQEENSVEVVYHREDGPAVIDPEADYPVIWYQHGTASTWKHVFADAAGDQDKEARILQNYLTWGDSFENEFYKLERSINNAFERSIHMSPIFGKKNIKRQDIKTVIIPDFVENSYCSHFKNEVNKITWRCK